MRTGRKLKSMKLLVHRRWLKMVEYMENRVASGIKQRQLARLLEPTMIVSDEEIAALQRYDEQHRVRPVGYLRLNSSDELTS